jgi:hypothetical protein
VAWERGIEAIKQAALQFMKEDVWKMDPALAEDSSTFQAAMILLGLGADRAWSDCIALFLEYPPALVKGGGTPL